MNRPQLAEDAYKKFKKDVQPFIDEYGMFWKNLFGNYGGRITPYNIKPIYGWKFNVRMIRPDNTSMAFEVYYRPHHARGITIFHTSLAYSPIKKKIQSENGLRKFLISYNLI